MKKNDVERAIRSHRLIAWTQAKDSTVRYGQVASTDFYGKFPKGQSNSRPATIRGVAVADYEPHAPVKDAIAVSPAEIIDGEPVIDYEVITLVRARDIQAMTSFAGRHDLTQGRR